MLKQLLEFKEKIMHKINRGRLRTGSMKNRIEYLRRQGMKIGTDCLIFSGYFGSEPYLIEIGNHVAVAGNCTFINHEGGEWLFRSRFPKLNAFGTIVIGDNTFIGIGCILLPGTEIGANCVVGAGSVLRGKFPDNSVIMGNPAKVVMKTSMFEKLLLHHKNRVDTRGMDWKEEREMLLKHFYGEQAVLDQGGSPIKD